MQPHPYIILPPSEKNTHSILHHFTPSEKTNPSFLHQFNPGQSSSNPLWNPLILPPLKKLPSLSYIILPPPPLKKNPLNLTSIYPVWTNNPLTLAPFYSRAVQL